VAHFFPEFHDWLKEVRDKRDPDQTIFPARFLLWMGLMLFLMRLGARRRLDSELDSPQTLINLNTLARDEQEKVAHHDTLNYFLIRLPLNTLPRLRRKMIRRLLRMKALDHGRLMGYFLVVFDGTGQLHFRERHCPHCLEQKHDEHTLYYHNVLEAKLVTPEGLAISLDSEFIENADPKASKQDCELKAFARIARRLKTDFPQLQLCLLLDGLFANGTAMSICQAAATALLTARCAWRETRLPVTQARAPMSSTQTAAMRVGFPARPVRNEGQSSTANPAKPRAMPSQPNWLPVATTSPVVCCQISGRLPAWEHMAYPMAKA